MIFFHGYRPDTWDAMVKEGLIRENAGIRFCQSIGIKEELKFNNLAKKGGKLYEILKETKMPMYIDRLQGGCYIENYAYDKELLNEYKEMLGENFYGFQMHEWLSNYRFDALIKLKDILADEWTAENIKNALYEKYGRDHLFLEAMTLEEMVEAGKPETLEKFYNNMTTIFKKRQKIGELIPCDSGFLAYEYELSNGVKRIMPEVGAQTPDARIQICYARGMTRGEGKSFGVYYEPWGGEPFSTCMYNSKNEWGIGEDCDFPYEPKGVNGGSSRSLQRRLFLYSYLSNAQFISEEWGLYNTFSAGEEFKLSPYGQVKKDFLDFMDKYADVGDKVVPMAAVLPKELPVLNNCHSEGDFLGFPVESDKLAKAKRGVREIFASYEPMVGSEHEIRPFKNTDIPDALDLLNRDDSLLKKYEYVVDLTSDCDFSEKHTNICEIKDICEKLRQILPCYVERGLHWMINECKNGGYYLTIFNHSGVMRSAEKGEYTLPEADKTVEITFKENARPALLEGNGELLCENGKYFAAVPAGEFVFIKF